MSEENNDNGKDVAKRYPYPRVAHCEIDGQMREVQILNISASGLQFAARARIDTKDPVKILWKDAHFGAFSPTFLIAREVHNSTSKEFPFFYGSQYFNLSSEVRQNLLLLLKNFLSEDKKETDEQLGKITAEHLFEVIDQGSSFLRLAFNGEKIEPYFNDIISEFKDYERHAFGINDFLSELIQEISIQGFYCNVLSRAITLMTDRSDLRGVLFQRAEGIFQQISKIEKEAEEFIKTIVDEQQIADREKKFIQKKINESINRMFQAKFRLLKAIVSAFGDVALVSPDIKELFKKFKEDYKKIESSIEPTEQEESVLYNRRTKKPNASPVVVLPVVAEKKPKYFLWFGIFFILVVLGGWGLLKLSDKKNTESLQEQMDIPVKIISYSREGLQINIAVSAQEWQKLTVEKKDALFKKVLDFLQKDRQARACIIFNEKNDHLKTLTEDMIPNKTVKP